MSSWAHARIPTSKHSGSSEQIKQGHVPTSCGTPARGAGCFATCGSPTWRGRCTWRFTTATGRPGTTPGRRLTDSSGDRRNAVIPPEPKTAARHARVAGGGLRVVSPRRCPHLWWPAGPPAVARPPRLSGRLAQPRPGDLIEWADGTLGRIWEVGTGHCEPDQVHVCNSLGSAFLGRGYVSISGGPFTVLQLGDLTATRRCALSCFWNWGDNSSGAGMDVEYWLARPVFHVDRLP